MANTKNNRSTGKDPDKKTKSNGSGSSSRALTSAGGKGGSGSTRSTGSSSAASSGRKTTVKEKVDANPPSSAMIHQFIPFLLVVALLFLSACFIFSKVDGAMGAVGTALSNLLCGLFGFSAFFIPLILLNLAVFWRKYVDMDIVGWKLSLSFVVISLLSSLFHVVYVLKDYSFETYVKSIFGSNWADGVALHGGGFVGGIIGGLFRCLTGSVGSMIILISALALSVMFLFSVTPRYVWTSIRYRIMLMNEKRAEREAQFATDEKFTFAEAVKPRANKVSGEKKTDAKGKKEHVEVCLDDSDDESDSYSARPSDLEEIDMDAPFITGTLEINKGGRETGKRKKNLPPLSEDGTVPFPPVTPVTPVTPVAPASDTITAAPAGNTDAEHTAQGTSDPERLLDEIFGQSGASDNIPPLTPASDNAFSLSPVGGSDSLPPEALSVDTELLLTKIEDNDGDNIGGNTEADVASGENDTDPSVSAVSDAGDKDDGDENGKKKRMEQLAAYIFPTTELLHQVSSPSGEDIAAELNSNAQKLYAKLNAFNVRIKKIEYSRGPTITRYELYPEANTRVRSIANLSDDIALELAATVRIEAPIPNKNAVGVEVPNASPTTVFIRELIESEKFRNMPSKLSACLGKDVGGNMVFADIAKMPHLLIAGTTGSGKSVCLNSIIISLLFKARPDEVQFIMIDPKKIEMGMYNKLPHLKVPVVTDMKKAAGTLNAAVNEMEHRYELFEEVNARDLDGYNRAMSMGDPDFVPLPKLVIIIDELADLMMTAPSEIEGSIIRIAQKARAAGIHLIVGTQRPSVNVITGLIKANIPSRIAFSVASGTDSRIIIDITGAEKLIGRGDMLYSPVGALKPSRVQGAFVADDEVEAVTDFIRNNNNPIGYDDDFMSDIERETSKLEASDKKGGGAEDDDDGGERMQAADELFTKALRIAVDNGTIATSFLQRKLSIGFGRAGKIIDRMEALGFVTAANGTKPRNVLLTKQQLMELEMAQDPRVNGNFN